MMHKLLIFLLGLVIVGAALGTQPSEAAVPGVNGQVAVQTLRDGDQEIYAMNPDRSGLKNLTNTAGNEYFPVWSADGSKIVFGGLDVHVVNADGSGPTNLTKNALGYGMPVWSPDGSKIAFHRVPGDNWDVYVMNADGSGPTDLVDPLADDMYFAQSPDRSKIAFSSMRSDPTPNSCPCSHEIFVMNADGSGVVRLTQAIEPMWDEFPDWSPDGSKIAFFSTQDDFNYEVYAMDADGSGPTNLTNYAALDGDPAWPPDGSKLVVLSTRDSGTQIFVMNANGSGPMRLTDAGGAHPEWQPTPPGVGGVAELPNVTSGSLEQDSSAVVAGIMAAVVVGVLALGGAAWHTRRRWGR